MAIEEGFRRTGTAENSTLGFVSLDTDDAPSPSQPQIDSSSDDETKEEEDDEEEKQETGEPGSQETKKPTN